MPSGPAPEARIPFNRYRLHWADGEDAGTAEYVARVELGDILWLAQGRKVRVIGMIDTPQSDRFEGLLRVEPA